MGDIPQKMPKKVKKILRFFFFFYNFLLGVGVRSGDTQRGTISTRAAYRVYLFNIVHSYKLYHSNPDIVLIILIYLLCHIKLYLSYLLLYTSISFHFIRYTYLCSERV